MKPREFLPISVSLLMLGAAACSSGFKSSAQNNPTVPVPLHGTVGNGVFQFWGEGLGVVSSVVLSQNGTVIPTKITSQNATSISLTALSGSFLRASLPLKLLMTTNAGSTVTNTLTVNLSGSQVTNFTSTGITDSATSTTLTLTGGFAGIGTISPNSTLHVNGPIATALASKSADYTITATDSILLVDASGAARTITLPTAASIPGRQYTIKKTDSSANYVTIATTASQTIDGCQSNVLYYQYGYVTVASDGSNWNVVQSSGSGIGGKYIGGACWYFGASGDSCTTTCTGHGAYSAITESYAGSSGGGGVVNHCSQILIQVGAQGGAVASSCGGNYGCGLYNANGLTYWCGSDAATTAGAFLATLQRTCACTQ